MEPINRRRFLSNSATIAGSAAVAANLATIRGASAAASAPEFRSRWDNNFDRVWLGPEYWANPLQDWRLSGGRIECVNAALDRNVHLLTRELGPQSGDLQMSVRIGRVGDRALGDGRGSFGFRIGIEGPLREYRNSLIFGSGLNAGVTADGGLFIGSLASAKPGTIDLNRDAVELRLSAEANGGGYKVTLAAYDPQSGKRLGQVERNDVAANQLVGNIALVANYGSPRRNRGRADREGQGAGRFWFGDWRLSGSKITAHDERAFGPILFSQYTLSGGTLKLSAQMPPVGAEESRTVQLQIDRNGDWSTVGEESIHPEARTATFRVDDWNDSADVPYRLVYGQRFADGTQQNAEWTGTIRRDPVDLPVLTVADISCNIHAAFPNHDYVAKMAKLNPDFLAFVGDQFYESTGGYGIVRSPLDKAILDYLRKWYIHGWTWREVMRDRPSISLPDDHDVYQGNIWGEAGAPREGTQEMGGYDMHPTWVNVVHRTQTSHHPDPYDPTPIKQNISVYYGPLTYGRISFAILADRMFKTGPEGEVPPTKGRGDHVVDPNFDPKTADLPGLQLLGDQQMKFLRDWAADWRGTDMKAVLSQTIFTAMATTHGRNRERLRADYDANGWPQTPRNEALREIRKAFAVHLAGDQHLPAVVHYGIDTHRDAGVAFAGPAVNVGYPRWWEPEEPGRNRAPGASEMTGDFTDHFGNPLTVLAVKNGAAEPRRPVLELMQDRASGMGLVRFDKQQRKITIECWPYLADPSKPGTQFPGWPVTIDVLDNYGRQAAAYLPTLEIQGVERPVVQVVDEANGETVYSLRIAGTKFQPFVYAEGRYTVRVSEPDQGRMKDVTGLQATAENRETLRVSV